MNANAANSPAKVLRQREWAWERRLLAAPLLILGLAVVMVPGCYVPPGTSFGNHFKTPLPPGVKVLHYYCDAYKDPQFLWVLSPIEPQFLNQVLKSARLQPALKQPPPAGGLGAGLVPWWDTEKIERIPELYFREPDASDGSYYRIWVDRRENRLYVLFVNT